MKTFRNIVFGMLTTAMVASSHYAVADGKFVTVDTVRSHGGNSIFSTLTATEMSSIQDGNISFDGMLHITNQQRTVPLTAKLVTVGEGEAPELSAIVENDDGLAIISYFTTSYDSDSPNFTKSFYSISHMNEEASSSIILTDDPLPVAAWLIAAAVGYLVAKDVYTIYSCDTSVYSQTEIDLQELKISSSLECKAE